MVSETTILYQHGVGGYSGRGQQAMAHIPCSSRYQQSPQKAEACWVCTLLNLCLPALEEVESI